MKKKIYFILSMVVILMLGQSCLFQEEDIFDDSAANRMTKTLKEYSQLLQDAPNGWLMEYYAEQEPNKIGGFNYVCYFDKLGGVKMSTDDQIGEIPLGQQVTSTYKLIADQGPVLSFDSFNEIFHYFTDPSPSNVNAYNGDFEFVIMKVSPEKIVLEGRKNRLRMTLTPLAREVVASEYLQGVSAMLQRALSPRYRVVVNDVDQGYVYSSLDKHFRFVLSDGESETVIGENVIFNPQGLKLYKPITLRDAVVENFEWTPSGDGSGLLVSTDANVNVKLIPSVPETYLNYESYLGTYTFAHGSANSPITVEVLAKKTNRNFIVRNLYNLDAEFRYNFSEGIMEVYMHYLDGHHEGNRVRVYPWDSSAGYLSSDQNVGGKFVRDLQSPDMKFDMIDNGVWGSFKAVGLFSRILDSSGGSLGTYERRAGPISMTKN